MSAELVSDAASERYTAARAPVSLQHVQSFLNTRMRSRTVPTNNTNAENNADQ